MPRSPELQQVGAVTFDFYGTLAHPRSEDGRGVNLLAYLRSLDLQPRPWDHRILYEVFASHHIDYRPDLSAAEKQRYHAALAERVFQRFGVPPARKPSPQEADAIWRILGPEAFSPYPEARAVLATVHSAGYRTAALSNWHCGLESFCDELGLTEELDDVIVSDEVGCAKPDPRLFAEACRRLGLPPAKILHVGDTWSEDVEGARAAGMPVLHLVRGDERGPDGVPTIRDLRGVLTYLGLAAQQADGA